MLHKSAQTVLETEWGTFDFLVFVEEGSGKEHIALMKEWGASVPLVRLHSKCATGDIFGSLYCDCGEQLHEGLRLIAAQGGILVYLDQEGRGLGLTHKIRAYELQRQGKDTVEADEEMGEGIDHRNYDLAAEILRDLQVKRFQLLTNNPAKVKAMEKEGFEVRRKPHIVEVKSERAKKYLEAKRGKMGHVV